MELYDVFKSDMEKKVTNRWRLIPLLIILAVAAYLRLYDIAGYMTFLGDEGRDVLIVKRMIVDHKFTLLGPTASVGGFFLGPIYYYFMLPFLWAWQLNPVGPAVMVALFGVATVLLVYIVGAGFFNRRVGLMAASLYAVSPLVIAYSRSSWNPNLVPFFSLILIYFLQKRKFLLAGIALGIGLQLHYLFIFMFVVSGLWMLWTKEWKQMLYIFAGFLIGYSPFLAFEIRHGFPNTQTIIRFVFSGQDTGLRTGFFAIVDDVLFRSFGRLLYRLPDGALWGKLPVWQLYAWFIGTRVTIFLSIVYLVKKRMQGTYKLLFVWLATVVVLFGFYQKGIYDYYFGIIFPLPFLLIGLLFERLKIVGIVLWLLLVVFNWQGRPFLYPPNHQLAQARRIAETALAHTQGKPFNFALITSGNSDHVYRYFFELEGNPPVTVENSQIDPERKTVTDQLIVICELSECKPLGHPLWEIAGFGRAQITGEWDVPFVKIFRLVHYKGT